MSTASNRLIDERPDVSLEESRRLSSFEIYRSHRVSIPMSLTAALVTVARRWRATLDDHLRPIGQSAARMETLGTIMSARGPCSQVDVANRLRIEGPTVTRMIDVLSRDGLVERRPAPHDKRTKHLIITEAGLAALEQIYAIADRLREDLLAELDEQAMLELRAVLLGLLARLDAGLCADKPQP